jgi:hypothetical protein
MKPKKHNHVVRRTTWRWLIKKKKQDNYVVLVRRSRCERKRTKKTATSYEYDVAVAAETKKTQPRRTAYDVAVAAKEKQDKLRRTRTT